jgi:pimeloyl-ACP methyl ester carboxylesterase
MGGDLCQAFVSRYPERVQRMVLIGCAPLSGPAGPVARLRSRWAIFKLRLVPMQRFRRQLAAGAAVNSQVQTYAANCLARMSRGDLIATWKAISSAAQIDAPDQLPCHTLMIVGERDDVGNGWVRQAALDWAKTEPSAELARIPAAGHITNMDAPDTVTQRILSFLNQAG